MSGDNDLIKLYSQRILALAAAIPLTERLPEPQSPPASARRSAARPSQSISMSPTAGSRPSART